MKKFLTAHEQKILQSDFPDRETEFDRETIEEFSRNTRGSVRLATGRYYTPAEMKKRAKKAFSVKLY